MKDLRRFSFCPHGLGTKGPHVPTYQAYMNNAKGIRLEGHPWGAADGVIPGLKGLGKHLGMRPHLHLDLVKGWPHHFSLEPIIGGLISGADQGIQALGGGGCP